MYSTDDDNVATETGFLAVGDGHHVYWETWGNPDGKPAVYLHGGPGSGFAASALRYFDPGAYRIVLFDQRGAGRSTPHAGAAATDLSTNTTAHLLADIERLRDHLAIDRWSVVAGSWGVTLALAYAERHPERVSDIVLFSITNTSRSEVEWITRGVGMFFPDAWARFCDGAASSKPNVSLVEAYHRLLTDPDPAIHAKAARDWCDWEIAIGGPHPRYESPTFRLGFARLVTHYWRHLAWLAEGELLRNLDRLADVPAVLVHGRLDIGSPPITAWTVSQAWPGSRLVLVDEAGHGSGHAEMLRHIRAATDRFAAV